jgi:hypothetical protein
MINKKHTILSSINKSCFKTKETIYDEFVKQLYDRYKTINNEDLLYKHIDKLNIFTQEYSCYLNSLYGFTTIKDQDYGAEIYFKPDEVDFSPLELLQYFQKRLLDHFYSVSLSETLSHHHAYQKFGTKYDDHRFSVHANIGN